MPFPRVRLALGRKQADSIQGTALGLCGCREAGCSVFSDPSHNSAAGRLRAGRSEDDLEGRMAGLGELGTGSEGAGPWSCVPSFRLSS